MSERTEKEKNARWALPAVIVAAALAIRFLHYFLTTRFNPLASSLQLDAATYDRWALALARGGDPGPTTLMQAPVYPWLLSILYRIAGPEPAAARAAQALLGAATVALTIYSTRRLFSSTAAALVAGTLAAFYAPFLFYEGLVLPATLIVFLNALIVAVFAAERGPGVARSLAGGILLGIAVAANPPTLLLLPFVLLHLGLAPRAGDTDGAAAGTPNSIPGPAHDGPATAEYRHFPAGARKGLRFAPAALLLCAGVAAALLPGTIQNYRASGQFIPLTTGGGINFYIGSNSRANGYYAPPVYKGESLGYTPEEQRRLMTEIASRESGRPLGEADVSRFWLDAGLRWARAHPAEWTALTWQKFMFFWNRYERANVESFSFHRRFPGMLRLPLVTFGIVAPLGLLGMFLARGRARRLALLHGGVVCYLATALAFYVTARYRLPVLPFLIPFAAAALVELVSIARRRSLGELSLLLAALVTLAVFTNFTVARDTPQGTASNLVRLGDIYVSRGDTTRAATSYREALELVPDGDAAKRGLDRIETPR